MDETSKIEAEVISLIFPIGVTEALVASDRGREIRVS